MNLHGTDGLLYFVKGADFKWAMVAQDAEGTSSVGSGSPYMLESGGAESRATRKRGCLGTAGFQTGGVNGALVPAAGLPSPGDATQPRLLGS